MHISTRLGRGIAAAGCAALIVMWGGCTETDSAPTVSSVEPANGLTGIPVKTKITALFSGEMDSTTLTAATFTLATGTVPVPGSVSYAGTTAVFDPTDDLTPNTAYTATISKGAADASGNTLAEDHVWTFITGSVPDSTAPTVSSGDPVGGASGVAINRSVSATFSEAMDPLTITGSTVTLTQGTTAVSGTVTYSGVTATFRPEEDLDYDTDYTVTVTTCAADLCGNTLAADRAWTFTTGAVSDATVPKVSATVPEGGASGASPGGKIAATFTEAMDPLTITTSTFTLAQGTTAVSGTVSYSGVTAVFCPTSELATGTVYTAKIAAGAADLCGNTLTGSRTWSFTTGTLPDTIQPAVSYTVPENGSAGVPISGCLLATFSKPMDPLTVTTDTFTLVRETTTTAVPVAGSVTYTGTTAVFTPAETLAAGVTYTATVLAGATDLAGNTPAGDHTWTFTTGSAYDTTSPAISLIVPASGATGVGINKVPTVIFTEAMNPLTIQTATFTLTQGTTAVAGTVSCSGVTATFNPRASLAADTEYTAKVTADAADLSGNTLSSSHSWTFTTGTGRDGTAPTLSYIFPADEDAGVPVNRKIAACFSEAMNPLTFTTETFTLMQGTTAVPGTVVSSGATATFTPAEALTPNTLYTAAVLQEATDLVGNALASDHVWTFTTGAASDTTRPIVSSTSPVAAATGVVVEKKITATFSEAIDPLTISTATFTLAQGTTSVAGTVSYTGQTATFTPTADLTVGTTYTATISTGTADLAGNTLAHNRAWSFTTETS